MLSGVVLMTGRKRAAFVRIHRCGKQAVLVLQDKPRDATVDAGVLARQTPGFSGAELSNLVNEAALLAAKTSKTKLSAELLESARDKAIMGVERKSAADNLLALCHALCCAQRCSLCALLCICHALRFVSGPMLCAMLLSLCHALVLCQALRFVSGSSLTVCSAFFGMLFTCVTSLGFVPYY